MAELVSIVLPTHNGARYIRECIASCLGQTYSPLELIVVENGSTDDTARILQDYRDERMIVLRYANKLGLPTALNTGFAVARGTYLTWIGDDDYFAPNAIEEMVQFLENNPAVDFVYCDFIEVDSTGKFLRKQIVGLPEQLKETNCIGLGFLYRRSVWESIGAYNPRAELSEDYEYWIRVSQRFQMRPLRKCLHYHRRHPHSLTDKRFDDVVIAAEQVRTQFFGLEKGRLRRSIGKRYMARAFEKYQIGDWSGVPRDVLKGIINQPSFLTNRGVYAIFFKSIAKCILR